MMTENGTKFKMKVTILFIFIFQISILTAFSAENYFVTQSGSGLHNGVSVENAFSASDFNNSVNWGIGAGKISGGDTVYLSGTITSALTMQGSGTNGNVITIDGSSATLSNAFSGSLRSYFALNNLTFSGFTGYVFLNLKGSSYATIDSLKFLAVPHYGIDIGRSGATQTHDITFTKLNLVTTNDYIAQEQRDLIRGCAYNITIEKSLLHKRWHSQTGSVAHNDIWQFWGSFSDSGCVDPSNMTLRHSLIITDVGYDGNYQFLMWEEGSGAHNIYGNIFIKKGTNAGGGTINIKEYLAGSTVNVYNNTIVQKDTASWNLLNITSLAAGTTVNFKNNIVYNSTGSGGTINKSGSGTFVHQYNTYYGGKSDGYLGTTCTSYASTGEMCDSNTLFTDFENNDFSLQPGSIAMGAGIYLGSVYEQQIKPASSWPNPTLVIPSTLNIGAYGNDILSLKQPMPPILVNIN